MKREIKVKVWDKYKKCFIDSDVYAILNPASFGAFGIMIKDWEDYREGEYFYDNAQELIEFTGLKDKNGKEIYEGDIIQGDPIMCTDNYKIKAQVIFSVKGMWLAEEIHPDYKETEYLFEITKDERHNCEVIGNIYENPELLKP